MVRNRSVVSVWSGTAVLALLALALAACGSSGKSNANVSPAATVAPTPTTSVPPATVAPTPTTPASPASRATVAVAMTGLGNALVDAQGRTVYMFSPDTATTSACTGACTTPWPPVTVRGTPAAGTGVKASRLGTLKRSDGTTQVTYSGHPLYTFFQDQKAGDTNGQGVNAFGGSWHVVSPSGS